MFLVIPLVEFLHVLGVDINVHHENPATFLCHVSVSSVKRSRHRLPRLVGTRPSRLEPSRDTRRQLGSHLSRLSPDSGAVERDLPSHRGTPQWNSGATSLVRSQSFGLLASRVRNSWLCFIPGTPLPSPSVSSDTAAGMPERAAPVAGRSATRFPQTSAAAPRPRP